jgi:uncharacterized repeat protein (TIGR03803 family)
MAGKFSLAARVLMALCLLAVATALSAQTEKVLHSFTGQTDGKYPFGSLTFDRQGNLYGTTYGGGNTGSCGGYGCGTAFQLIPGPTGKWRENVLLGFNGRTDGAYVYGGLIQGASGNLYGTTYEGTGRGCCGEVYMLTPTTTNPWDVTVLYAFTGGSDGGTPLQGSLTLDAAGNLYGVTAFGGNNAPACGGSSGSGCGVVFQLSPTASGSWTETILYAFAGGNDGLQPQTQLVFDKAGNLYGTTYGGGVNGLGVVFELSHASGTWQETVLHAFAGSPDGARPSAGGTLSFDAVGNLYGTTTSGGVSGNGTVFELSPSADGTWNESVLYSFRGGHDGVGPAGGVAIDASGNLYGTTEYGGILDAGTPPKNAPGCGTVYKLAPGASGTWSESILHHFTCLDDGGMPVAGVILDASGNIYGTTASGGKYNDGVVFEVIP